MGKISRRKLAQEGKIPTLGIFDNWLEKYGDPKISRKVAMLLKKKIKKDK